MDDVTLRPEADPLALDNQVCFALAVASRGVIGLYRPLLEPLGLTHPQYLVMLALWQRRELTATDLRRLLQLDAGTLSPLLKRLQAAGLVDRTRRTDDERVLTIRLTDKGAALREQALAVPHAVIERLGLDLPVLVGLHASLTTVIRALTD